MAQAAQPQAETWYLYFEFSQYLLCSPSCHHVRKGLLKDSYDFANVYNYVTIMLNIWNYYNVICKLLNLKDRCAVQVVSSKSIKVLTLT